MAVSAMVTVVLAASSARAGPPFLSDDPDPTPLHEYEIYLFANGVRTPGELSGAFGIDFNYGAARDLQLTATLPIDYDRAGGAENAGLGNVELAAKLRFLHQEDIGLDVAFFPRVFLPSPSSFGENHASLLMPIWIGRSGGNWSTFGGGGCAINRGGRSKDYCIAGGAATWTAREGLVIGGEIFHQTADIEGGSDSTIAGAGITIDFNDHLHWLGYLGAGLQNAAEHGRLTGYTSLLFTF